MTCNISWHTDEGRHRNAALFFVLSKGSKMHDNTEQKIAELEARVKNLEKIINIIPPASHEKKLNLENRIVAMLENRGEMSVPVLSNRLKVDTVKICVALSNLERLGRVAQKKGKRLYRGHDVLFWRLNG